jgi:hypothetical protein
MFANGMGVGVPVMEYWRRDSYKEGSESTPELPEDGGEGEERVSRHAALSAT